MSKKWENFRNIIRWVKGEEKLHFLQIRNYRVFYESNFKEILNDSPILVYKQFYTQYTLADEGVLGNFSNDAFSICGVDLRKPTGVFYLMYKFNKEVYCNLGFKTTTDSGSYSCVSPKVIPRGDKFALALVEFNKAQYKNIHFRATIISSPGVNLTTLDINLDFYGDYSTRLGHMAVVIGFQTENRWLDLVNVIMTPSAGVTSLDLPNIQAGTTDSNYLDYTFSFPNSSNSFLTRISNHIVFPVSFGMDTGTNDSLSRIEFSFVSRSMSYLTIRIKCFTYANLLELHWGVLVWDTSVKPANVVYEKSSIFGTTNMNGFYYDFSVDNFKLYGPSYDTKCLLGHQKLEWNTYLNDDTQFFFVLTGSNIYVSFSPRSLSGKTSGYESQFLCFADNRATVVGVYAYPSGSYLDTLTGQIYFNVSDCTLPPTNQTTDQCQRCAEIQCLYCDHATRANCFQCAPTHLLLASGICKECSQLDPNCLTCALNAAKTNIVCSSCAAPYPFNPILKVCTYCDQTIPNCLSCIFNTTSQTIQCTLCAGQFIVDSQYTCQACKIGIYASNNCFYFPTCGSVVMIKGIPRCIACSLLYSEFNETQGQCVCQKGFYLNSLNDSCEPKCGDKIKVLNETCDDGNFLNNDGCDDHCQLQLNFLCETDGSCAQVVDIILTLDYTLKVEEENKAQIYFTVTPSLALLSRVNWEKTVNFTFPGSQKISKISFLYQNGVLIATLAYNENIEGALCSVFVKFDEKLVKSSSQFMTFPIEALNEKLLYKSPALELNEKIVRMAGFVVGIVALVCFIISANFHKMIGLETIQFIQLIYFVRVVFDSDSLSEMTVFNSLKYSNGYSEINLHGGNYRSNPKLMGQVFVKIKIKLYFLQNCNLMLIPIGVASMGYGLYMIQAFRASSRYLLSREIIYKDRALNINRKLGKVYENFIFSYSLAMLYITIFQMLAYQLSSISKQNYSESEYAKISFGISLIILFYIFCIFSGETIKGFKTYLAGLNHKQNHFGKDQLTNPDQKNKDYHPLYVPFYLLYQFFLIILINLSMFQFQYLPEMFIGIVFFYTAVFACWKPYTLSIQNTANIFHQSVLIIFITLQVLDKHDFMNQTAKIVSLYTTIVFIGLSLVFQIIRLYVYTKSAKKRALKIQKQTIQKKNEASKQAIPNNLINYMNQGKSNNFYQNSQMSAFDHSTVLGREIFRQKLREQKLAEKQRNTELRQRMHLDLEQDSKETLKKIKDKLRKRTNPHEQWIFNQILQ